MFPLVTPRLSLRPLAAEDTDALLSLYSDWEVARWLSRLLWPFTSDSAQTMISEAMMDLERARGYFLRIDERTSGTFVGTVSLRLPAYDDEPWTTDTTLAILGYAVVPEEHGRGFATEAAATIVQLAFGDLDLHRLRATALRDNIASRRVLERLGFRIRYTDVREVPRYGGPPRVGDTYMLERDDWQAAQRNR
jgi:RimJ/RimL family protein N-acetyltransferase